MIELLARLGVGVTLNENMQVEVTAKNLTSFRAPYELVKTMRASFWSLVLYWRVLVRLKFPAWWLCHWLSACGSAFEGP